MKIHVEIEVSGAELYGKPYRFAIYRQARQREIYGFVKYLNHHVLLITAEGEQNSILEFLAWCKDNYTTSETNIMIRDKTRVLNYSEFRILDLSTQQHPKTI
jgi:acylphosphatase